MTQRVIKFRGKRVDNGEWVYGDFIHGVKHKQGKSYILPENINQPGCHHLDGFEVISETVGQFTGLLDKNGKEIYEGDIAACSYGLGQVVFYAGCFMMKWILSDALMELLNFSNVGFKFGRSREYEKDPLEIIGTIHDNPELLK